MATLARSLVREETIYRRMAIGFAAVILFAFGQFGARGLVDYRQVPVVVHIHAIAMVAWLGVFVTQSTLAERGAPAMHRQLGWAGLALALAIPPLAIATCVTVLRAHAVPPFFTPAFFLSLVAVESITFAGLVIAAIMLRRRTDWHRRLLIGSTIILLEPALGRLLPMPLMGGWGEWVAMAVQLLAAGLVARNDIARLGKVHPATWVAAAAIVFTHVLDTALGATPQVVAFVGTI
jgi:hypothetical protein